MEQTDYVLLKWGTIKAWDLENSPEAFEALKKYGELGVSLSAVAQDDTNEQKELLCQVIDKVNGTVQNDWSGEIYSDKEEAKKYIREYKH